MKDSLKPGLNFEFHFKVPENRTVPHLLPESDEFRQMPEVLASGFMVGLIEWACIQTINPHLDWPGEQTVGIDFRLNHTAATPPGLTVRVQVRLEKMEGRKLSFSISVDDGVDKISQGTHDRFVIDFSRFTAKMEDKLKGYLAGQTD